MEDHQIISLFLSRSDDAIVELKGKYGGLCRSVILNILHDPSEAEECLNDTLLGVWNAIPPAQPQTLSAFVCRIARNLALKRVEYHFGDKTIGFAMKDGVQNTVRLYEGGYADYLGCIVKLNRSGAFSTLYAML